MSFIKVNDGENVMDRFRETESDIVCYKMIEERLTPSGRIEYWTLPLYKELSPEIVGGETNFKATGDDEIVERQVVGFYIGRGFIHAFSTLEEAENEMRDKYYGYEEVRPVIYRCVIPKGTVYAECEVVPNYKGYVSKEILFGEPLIQMVNRKVGEYVKMVKPEKKKRFGIMTDEEYNEREDDRDPYPEE